MQEEQLPIVWRKHPIVLLELILVPALQLGISVIVFFFTLIRVIPLDMVQALSLVIIFCSMWTVFYVTRLVRRPGKKNGAQNTLGGSAGEAIERRQALLQKLSAPLRTLVAGFSIIISVATLLAAIVAFSGTNPYLIAMILLYYLFLIAWLAFQIVDWRNDQYILTKEHLLDITRIPVLFEQQTKAPLSMIQNISTNQKGWGRILGYGDVIIETAGKTRSLLFVDVPNPWQIQERIFRQIDNLKKEERQREMADVSRQTQHWLAAYYTLTSGIRDLEFPHQVGPEEPLHIMWRVEGPAGRPYRTWLVWDVVSHAQGGEYAYMARPYGRAPYRHADIAADPDGIGRGRHAVRGLSFPAGISSLYFRVAVQFEGEARAHSSPEMSVTVEMPAYV